MTATPAPLAPELVQGLKRTQLAHFRPQAAEILQTATTQRWSPEQFLRTLLSTEIAGRDAANQAARLKRAGFPVEKSFEGFQIAISSVPEATVNYVASLEWLRARENLCLIGPAGTGKPRSGHYPSWDHSPSL
jgi:DNA replication protein DnaC